MHLDAELEDVGSNTPQVVRRSGQPRPRVAEDERLGPVRVRRREQDGHRPAVVHTDERGLGRTDGVEHREQIGHPVLDRRRVVEVDRVGPTASALVEGDEPGERRQSPQEAGRPRLLPEQRRHARAETQHEIDRAVAHDLVGNVRAARPGVAHVRDGHVP
jgi:hypothetical protein